ncbi:MAG: hypothetical protein Q7S84_04220 [bacterium]|nr:hypothetical protein [bacterium]
MHPYLKPGIILAAGFSLMLVLSFQGSLTVRTGGGAVDAQPKSWERSLTTAPATPTTAAGGAADSRSRGDTRGGENYTTNLTDQLTASYVNQVTALGERGIANGKLAAPNQQQIELVLAQNISTSLTAPKIAERDLSQSAGGAADEVRYFNELGAVTSRIFGESPVTVFDALREYQEGGDAGSFQKLASIAELASQELRVVAVPPRYLALHMELANLWEKKRVAYTAIVETASDPLKAYLAVQTLPELTTKTDELQARYVAVADGPALP